MKRLRMLSNYAGPSQCVNSGEVGSFPDEEAANLVKAGYAIPAEKGEEKAVAGGRENATRYAGAERLATALAEAEAKASDLEKVADEAEGVASKAKYGARKVAVKKAKAARKAASVARKKANGLKAAAAKK